MKIVLQQDVMVATKDGRCDIRKAGEIVSVFHRMGRRLLYNRAAKWVGAEEGDPFWMPVPMMRAAIPERDKMIRSALNK